MVGVRQDAYANAYRIPVEEDKPAQERGTYLTPEAFGKPIEKRADGSQQQADSQQATTALAQRKEN
ncbi:MAG TPA: hypothetical protein VM870_00280 [Pyrinomonadaceae bacterium]|jgi:hypothetical protein|nr:hypothetical protein [Pyrinomonadaceae bacterium]